MILGFKTEVKVNQLQRLLFAKHAGVARHAYNWGLALTKQILDQNKANPESKIKFPSAIDLHKWLVALVKSENPWYYECAKSAPQEALRALRKAWDRCFQKVSGVPNFKKKGKNDSFTLEGGIKILGNNKIQVPKIGVLKTYERLPQVHPKSVTISTQADRWFISFRFDVEANPTPKIVEFVGVDLGINHLATLSTGKVFDGAKSYRKYQKKLSRMQWLNRHRQVGSSNYRKAQLKVARLHRKIANIRSDTVHKITTHISKNHAVIWIEDLNVSGLMSNGNLAKLIAECGFYEFRRQLEYKTQLYGSKLVVVDRFYPSSKTCSNCQSKKKSLSLRERVFKCDHCSFECDRDLNAAINLSHCVAGGIPAVASGVQKAARSVVSACGLGSADASRLKQEENLKLRYTW